MPNYCIYYCVPMYFIKLSILGKLLNVFNNMQDLHACLALSLNVFYLLKVVNKFNCCVMTLIMHRFCVTLHIRFEQK